MGRVRGGGHTARVYAIRQAVAKSMVAFYQKYVDEASKQEIKDILLSYDRTLLVADPRRSSPRSSAARALAHDTRSRTVKRRISLCHGSPLEVLLFAEIKPPKKKKKKKKKKKS